MSAEKDAIMEARRLLAEAEAEYLRTHDPCMTNTCGLYKESHPNHCAWSVITEDCKDFTSEPREES